MILLRKALWTAGHRYRLNYHGLPGQPDIVFVGKKVAIFVDGDFWHGKNWAARKRKLSKGNNPDYWIQQIETNIARDKRNQAELQDDGWTVLRFWESDIKKQLESILQIISREL